MVRCTVCKQSAEGLDAVLLTCDGDFACSEACAEKWRKDRDHFFNNVIHDDQAFANWIGVDVKDLGPGAQS